MRRCSIMIFVFTCIVSVQLSYPQQPSLMNVKSWAYQLQNISIDQIANNHTFELIVIDYSRDGTGANAFTPQQISQIKNSGKKAIAYISIGEAEDYRDYWNSSWKIHPPAWLGPENPNWKGNYKVRFWYPEWQNIIFNYVNNIIDQGFDGIYMDIIDAYYYWMQENPEQPRADSLMIQFVLNIRNHIQSRTTKTFNMIPQNAEEIINSTNASPELKSKYLSAINAVGVEDVFFYGNLPEDNPFNPTASRIIQLQEYLSNGKQVFSIEYLTDSAKIAQYKNATANQKFIPYISTRSLNKLFDGIQTDVDRCQQASPYQITLEQNYPNPFSSSTTIRFSVETRHAVTLRVYNVFGREVLDLSNQINGNGELTIHNSQLPKQGVYFYRLTTPTQSQTKMMVMMR